MNNFTQNQKKIFIVLIIIVVGIISYYVYTKDSSYEEFTEEEIMVRNNENEVKETSGNEKIKVHIMGAVKNAGIVELEENSRIADAIDLAGGLTEDANMDKINLAYVLEDGMKIKIPSINDKEDIEKDDLTTDEGYIVENDFSNIGRK